ncbi:hypothetical protein M513_01955 [Trichuris suis]|uniref:Zinc transporter 5 n=1 Tax=Trichuris suis TaxID=68888 RepID=A0A085MIM4_9BILA|nr:hypothetical protein M513_01955 [Trichuris suis]
MDAQAFLRSQQDPFTTRTALGFGALWIVKCFKLVGMFLLGSVLRFVPLIQFMALVKLIIAIASSWSFRSKFGTASISRRQCKRALLHSLLSTGSQLCWLYGVILCGPLRAVLVGEIDSCIVFAALSTLFLGSGSPSKARGSMLLSLGFATMILLDPDAKESLHSDNEFNENHHLGFNHLFHGALNVFGFADHKVVNENHHLGFNHLFHGALNVFGFADHKSLPFWYNVPFFYTLVCIVLVFGADIALSTVNHFRLSSVQVARFYCCSCVTAFVVAWMWFHSSLHAEHRISGGVFLASIFFSIASFVLTTPNAPKAMTGQFVGFSTAGLPLYVCGEDFLQRTSESFVSFVKSTVRQILSQADSRRIFFFLCVNLFFTFIEFMYGIWTNSLGLISDAFHMLFDCSALVVGLIAAVMSTWKPTKQFSYGFARLEVLSGFINGLFLLVIAFFIFIEAIERLFDPPEVYTEKLLFVSVVGLLVNLFGIFVFQGGHGHSHGGHGHSHGGHGHSHGVHGHSHTPDGHGHGGHDHIHGGHSSEGHHGHNCEVNSHDSDLTVNACNRLDGSEHAHDHCRPRSGMDDHERCASNDNLTLSSSHVISMSVEQSSEKVRPAHHSHGNANMQGVFLHVLADTLGSVAVIISTLLIHHFGWLVADPICSSLLSVLIACSVMPLLNDATKSLLLKSTTESESEFRSYFEEISRLNGVISYSRPRVWVLKSDMHVATVHVHIAAGADQQLISRKTNVLVLNVATFLVLQASEMSKRSALCTDASFTRRKSHPLTKAGLTRDEFHDVISANSGNYCLTSHAPLRRTASAGSNDACTEEVQLLKAAWGIVALYSGNVRYGIHFWAKTELMTGDAPQRNWWGIGIALLIILSIAAIISIAIVLLAPGNSNQYTGKQPISIEDIVSPKASEANPEPKWLSSDTFAYKDSNCSIWSVRIRNGGTTVTQLVDEQSCQNRKFSSFKPSPSGSCIAFAYSTRQIYRHSETARYNITCSLIGVDHDREYPVGPNKTGSELIQLFLWSPGSNDSFAFVYNNNIYYQEHVLSDPVQITASATESNFIRNGVADWVYEEEVLETSNALWWSYKGRSIAYATFDDRNVEKVILPYYPNDSVYPTNVEIAYPKVAASLPEVSLHVWDKITGETLSVIPPPEVLELREKYLFSVNWVQSSGSDESLLVVWANRVQNSVFISYCKPPKYECILNYNQNYDDLWAEPSHYKIRFTDESKYYVILPQLVKESSNGPEYRYSHVAQITIPISGQNGKATFLTHGSWEVSKIVGLSKKENRVYFIAALPNPRQRHLYSVSASPNGDDPVCLTCNLTKLGCSYVAAVFSYDGGHYILYCQGPDIPSVRLFSVGNEKPLFIVEDNLLLRKYFDTKRFPDVQYKEVQLPNGYSKVFKRSLSFAYACQSILAALLKILYPPDFEEQSNKDFLPAVLKVYAGPNTQSVLERLDFSFDTYLASSRKYVVVYIDGRGSGARGSKYTSSVYKNLGFPEIQDQIEAFKIFISQSSLVDRQKAAVWGWSYGGFSTARIVQMNAFQTFKCAISVAPVTNFRLYDAAYTERYLGLYENNVVGYERTNVAKNVTAFGLGKYLLIHGSFDDNVHYQNTAAFVEALTAQNIKFQMMVYTNEKHSISNRRMHLNTLMDDFLVDCFA